MPRPRLNQHVVHSGVLHQPMHPTTVVQQRAADPQVQRSQGVIYLTANKPQLAPQHQVSAHSHLPVSQPPLVPQIPAHHSSMFHAQPVPSFVPSPMVQNPFFPYYHQMTPAPLSASEVYMPNGQLPNVSFDNYMQAPPTPIKTKKKRKSKVTQESDSDSDDSELMDDEEDPDWNPVADEMPEPIIPKREAPRGRRSSTSTRGQGAGRGRGGARGRGRGRGRGRISNSGNHQDAPPNLVNQSNQMYNQMQGRQTRSGQIINMPSLDLQTTATAQQQNQLSFGELVSAAVQSLNDPEHEYASSSRRRKTQTVTLSSAVVTRKPDGSVVIEKITVSSPVSLFVPIDKSYIVENKSHAGEFDPEIEEDDLILAYEIVQEEDKHRPFLCEMCGKESRSRVLHNRHLVTHEPDLRFACCICSELFADHDKLKPHLRKHHGSGIFVCPELDCEGIFQERKSLDDHEFACHPDARPFVCRFCLDRFPTLADSLSHEDSHVEEITANCLKCGVTYKTKTDMKNHYSHMHEEKTCQFCSEKFENQPALDEHLNASHAELIKPPEPEPVRSPEPTFLDDGPASPIGGDNEDDIVCVEERETPASSKPSSSKPSSSKPRQRPEIKKPRNSVKSSENIIVKKPAARSKSLPDEVITLSSDSEDEKDPEWIAPGKSSKRHGNLSSPITRRASRKKSEYVVIVESRTDENAKDIFKNSSKNTDQPLTFVMGESGELVHVPTEGDPMPPDSLPIKEIMEIIKTKDLSDNTTIVIEDNKIASIKATGKEKDVRKSSSRSDIAAKQKHREDDLPSKKWVRPAPEFVDSVKTKPGISRDRDTKSSELHLKFKPPVVAKKSTGGGKRRREKERVEETKRVKIPTTGAIARKRTGGTSSIYDSIKRKSDSRDTSFKELSEPSKAKHPRKLPLEPRLDFDTVDDRSNDSIKSIEVVKSKTVITNVKSSAIHASDNRSHKKKGKKRGRKSKSQSKSQNDLKKFHHEQGTPELSMTLADYDHAPKRSLRIALKASVSEASGGDSQLDTSLPESYEDILPSIDSTPSSKRSRANGSSVGSSSSAAKSRMSNTKTTGNHDQVSSLAASDGQVVMKALVNGKWQDVVIGTKLTSDPPEPMQPPVSSKSNFHNPVAVDKRFNAKKSTGGHGHHKKKPPPSPVKNTSAGRRGRRSGSGRKGKPAGADPSDCWRDDRYQYISIDNLHHGSTIDTSQSYNMTENLPLNEDAQYSYGQEYADDDTIMPFSLSSYMDYHEDSPQAADADHGLPVIVSAYHVDTNNTNIKPEESAGTTIDEYKRPSEINHVLEDENYVDDQPEEIPISDPLGFDEASSSTNAYEGEGDGDDPLGSPAPPPPPPVVPKKGTVQDATSAISNLRSVLSMIKFKK